MSDGWFPTLALTENSGRCQLALGGWVRGEGPNLQAAADDLVVELLAVLVVVRGSGFHPSTEVPLADLRMLDYLWRLGEIAAEGGDVREALFGS